MADGLLARAVGGGREDQQGGGGGRERDEDADGGARSGCVHVSPRRIGPTVTCAVRLLYLIRTGPAPVVKRGNWSAGRPGCDDRPDG